MRGAFISWCQMQMGKPYTWGAKGPDAYDCSGFVTAGIRACGGPDWRQTHNSQALFDALEPTDTPEPGDLAFYGPPGKINHVMVHWIDGRVIGACGGDSSTTTAELATARGAAVQFRKQVRYRPDFRGFRRLPL